MSAQAQVAIAGQLAVQSFDPLQVSIYGWRMFRRRLQEALRQIAQDDGFASRFAVAAIGCRISGLHKTCR